MMNRTMITVLVTLFVLAQAHHSFAQITVSMSHDNWTLLETKEVNYTLDRDVLYLKESGNSFKSLKFIVKNGTLNMHKCTVDFKNGDTKEVDFPGDLNYTNDGRVLDLKGNQIEKVTFWYDTKNESEEKSIVELWGK